MPAVLSSADAIESRLRHIVLETLNRLPNNEVLKPYVVELLRLATDVMSCDNEDNSLTCLRIIFDLHKNFRPTLESEVQAFLNLVQQIYSSLPKAVSHAFASNYPPRSQSKCVGASITYTDDGSTVPRSPRERHAISRDDLEVPKPLLSYQAPFLKQPQSAQSVESAQPHCFHANDRLDSSCGQYNCLSP